MFVFFKITLAYFFYHWWPLVASSSSCHNLLQMNLFLSCQYIDPLLNRSFPWRPTSTKPLCSLRLSPGLSNKLLNGRAVHCCNYAIMTLVCMCPPSARRKYSSPNSWWNSRILYTRSGCITQFRYKIRYVKVLLSFQPDKARKGCGITQAFEVFVYNSYLQTSTSLYHSIFVIFLSIYF